MNPTTEAAKRLMSQLVQDTDHVGHELGWVLERWIAIIGYIAVIIAFFIVLYHLIKIKAKIRRDNAALEKRIRERIRHSEFVRPLRKIMDDIHKGHQLSSSEKKMMESCSFF